MSVSIQDLKAMVDDGGPDALRCSLLFWKFDRPNYTDWATLVEKTISYEVSLIAKRRSDLNALGEDALTAVLVVALEAIGLQATSARVNGNCDLTVSYDNYLWLGEAKLYTGAAHVWGGYLQLTARYSTGLPNQSRGGMLLYCVKDTASVLLAEWRAVLSEQVQDANARDGALPLTFISADVCASSGLPLELVHFAFPLFHVPTEDSIKLSPEALRAGRAAKKSARET
jgi:hypothetical protein